MDLDFKEITSAWYNKFVHTNEMKELADNRLNICLDCPSKLEGITGFPFRLRCGECGCPLKAKVYTDKTYLDEGGSCPLNKWKDIEIEHFKKYNKAEFIKPDKNKKTLL
jgi:hypothetical protein